MRYALDRDIDQPADNDREHHQQRHPRAQMQFAEAGRHQLPEEDRQQHQHQDEREEREQRRALHARSILQGSGRPLGRDPLACGGLKSDRQ
jgi:hypothetical protein